jgi:hypothetical protein
MNNAANARAWAQAPAKPAAVDVRVQQAPGQWVEEHPWSGTRAKFRCSNPILHASLNPRGRQGCAARPSMLVLFST